MITGELKNKIDQLWEMFGLKVQTQILHNKY